MLLLDAVFFPLDLLLLNVYICYMSWLTDKHLSIPLLTTSDFHQAHTEL